MKEVLLHRTADCNSLKMTNNASGNSETITKNNHIFSVDFILKCHREDYQCMKKSGQTAWPIVAAGIPELGVKASDPFMVDVIENNHNGLELKFTDFVIIGGKECLIQDIK